MDAGVGLGAQEIRPPAQAVPAVSDETDDATLVAALAAGDARALERLYTRYSRSVYSLAYHLLGERGTAEEVVQETFLKLWRRPAVYQPSRGRLAPWLLGVAHHHAVDLLRRRQLERRHQVAPAPTGASGLPDVLESLPWTSEEGDPEACAGAGERRQAVLRALTELPPAQRVPLELAYYRGLTQTEIATLLGEPLGTVKTRMRLGLQRLRGAPGLVEVWMGQ